MTTDRHLERDLPAILSEIAMGRYPDYIDDVLATTAQRRQRPAWTFPERWLPVDLATKALPGAPRLPWRALGVLALLALLIALAVAAYVGSRPRLPDPFGLAAKGHVVYAYSGDIYGADAVTGVATAIVTGPDTDSGPVYSRDGTHLAFVRNTPSTPYGGQLFVAGADGRELVAVTPDPVGGLGGYAFSPDGREILYTVGDDSNRQLWIAKSNGSGTRQLDVGMIVANPSYRPPKGAEIVFAGKRALDKGSGLYAIDVASRKIRTILGPKVDVGRDYIKVSPDGSLIAYTASDLTQTERNSYSVHIVGADGQGDRALPMPDQATFQDAPAWSNDGTHLAVVRGYATHNEDMALAVIPADGSGFGIETVHGLTGCCDTVFEWAPDDTTILVKPEDLDGHPLPPLLWDPATGKTSRAPWTSTSDPAWQRVAR